MYTYMRQRCSKQSVASLAELHSTCACCIYIGTYKHSQALCHTIVAVSMLMLTPQQLFKEEPPQSDGMPSQEVLSELHEVVQAAGIEGEEGCLWGAFNTTKGPTVSTYIHTYIHIHTVSATASITAAASRIVGGCALVAHHQCCCCYCCNFCKLVCVLC
jgi:hypothetical protein